MEQKIKNFIKKNFKKCVKITSYEISKGGVICLEGIHENGKKYEFYYTPEYKFFRGIYDGWNNTMFRDIEF